VGSNLSIKNANPSFSYHIDIKASLSTGGKEVCPKKQGKPRGSCAQYQAKMEIPPAVQITAGGMLFYLSVSKEHRHVKRQMPDAVFLHYILWVENVGCADLIGKFLSEFIQRSV
jgi:hypothetical protein